MGDYKLPDSRRCWEMEGSGQLGAKQHHVPPRLSRTPEAYRRLYNKMADPIDSAL